MCIPAAAIHISFVCFFITLQQFHRHLYLMFVCSMLPLTNSISHLISHFIWKWYKLVASYRRQQRFRQNAPYEVAYVLYTVHFISIVFFCFVFCFGCHRRCRCRHRLRRCRFFPWWNLCSNASHQFVLKEELLQDK